jgi:hypothetical protein
VTKGVEARPDGAVDQFTKCADDLRKAVWPSCPPISRCVKDEFLIRTHTAKMIGKAATSITESPGLRAAHSLALAAKFGLG